MDTTSFRIRANTQLTYEKLRIGVGNIREEKNTNQTLNKSSMLLTVGLWIFYRDAESLNKQMRVHADQKIEVGEYSLVVDEINLHNETYVKLRITKISDNSNKI